MPFLVLRKPTTPPPPIGFNFYISPTGSDDNDGLTPETAWAITALVTKRAIYRGFRIGATSGIYDVSGMTPRTGGFNALFEMHGGFDAETPTVLEAVTPRTAIIKCNNGSSYPFGDCAIIGDYESGFGHLHILGIKIEGAGSKGIWLGNADSVGQTGYRVEDGEYTGWNCTSQFGVGGNYSCIGSHRASGIIVRNNYFHDNVGVEIGSADHWAAINTFGVTDGIFEFNTLVNSGGIYGKNDFHHGNKIRFNYIDSASMPNCRGIQDWAGSVEDTGGTATEIYGNIVLNCYQNDLRKSDGQPGYFHPLRFFNNTCITRALPGDATYAILARPAAGLLDSYNNILIEDAEGDHGYVAYNIAGPGAVDFNHFYRPSGAPRWATFPDQSGNDRTGYDTFEDYQTAIDAEANSVSGSDPLFVGSGSGPLFYQLQPGSPCVGTGRSNGTTGGTACDKGAWGGATPPPRIGCNFGPFV